MSDYRASTLRTLPAALRYAIAVAIVAIALILSLILQVPFENPSWFFFPLAILATTWISGAGPGWLSVFLSTLAVLYFFIPPFHTWILRPRDIPFFLSFALCGILASRLVAWRNRTEDSLIQARDQLEVKVVERTSELEKANEALQGAQAELARIARITMVGELAASIAHEVNQPLAAVVANADACVAWLALEDPDLSEVRAAADRAVQGATRASEVIARIRSLINKGSPQRIPVALNEVIEETVDLIKGQATRNKVSTAIVLDSKLPPVLGDKIQLQQVILNLMTNAIEAMTAVEDRSRDLEIRSEATGAAQVRISVRDTGIGMDPQLLPQLFEPFFTTRAHGIGMGLPISRSIIEAHSGRLWVESVVNEGSTFHFTLPVEDGATV